MRKTAVAFLLGAAIVAAGALSYGVVFDARDEVPEWILASYSGGVEVSVHGAEWRPAELKMRLQGHDRIRTAGDGEAMLVHGESHVMLRPKSDVEVAVLTDDSSRFQVAEGMVDVEARGTSISMRSAAGAQVDGSDAGFAMSVKRDGWTQVMGKRGEVDFSSMGRTERVKQGEMASAAPGEAPTAPVRIPESLLLNVQFPDAATFSSRLAVVRGTTDPGQRVAVGGREVEVGRDGTFELEVELEEGVNELEVVAHDAMGRTRSETSGPIRVDTTAPTLTGVAIGSRRGEARP